MRKIQVPAFFDVHHHLREGSLVKGVLELCHFGGIEIVGPMPNTKKGLTKAKHVTEYIDFAKSCVPKGVRMRFVPFGMVNEKTTKRQIDEFVAAGITHVKVYPLNRTTKSHNGVYDYYKLLPVVKYCGEKGVVCHFHPEHPWMLIENRDAEYLFLSIVEMFLRETKTIIVWEHGTDGRCIRFWKEMAKTGRFFVTLSAHHLATSESLAYGDVRAVCKPPTRTEDDRLALIQLVHDDYVWVMAGSDSAIHRDQQADDGICEECGIGSKHVHQGTCACGALTAQDIMPLYAHSLDSLLETKKGVKTFVRFTSGNACAFHKMSPPVRKLTLVRSPHTIASVIRVGPIFAEPFWAGKEISWTLAK